MKNIYKFLLAVQSVFLLTGIAMSATSLVVPSSSGGIVTTAINPTTPPTSLLFNGTDISISGNLSLSGLGNQTVTSPLTRFTGNLIVGNNSIVPNVGSSVPPLITAFSNGDTFDRDALRIYRQANSLDGVFRIGSRGQIVTKSEIMQTISSFNTGIPLSGDSVMYGMQIDIDGPGLQIQQFDTGTKSRPFEIFQWNGTAAVYFFDISNGGLLTWKNTTVSSNTGDVSLYRNSSGNLTITGNTGSVPTTGNLTINGTLSTAGNVTVGTNTPGIVGNTSGNFYTAIFTVNGGGYFQSPGEVRFVNTANVTTGIEMPSVNTIALQATGNAAASSRFLTADGFEIGAAGSDTTSIGPTNGSNFFDSSPELSPVNGTARGTRARPMNFIAEFPGNFTEMSHFGIGNRSQFYFGTTYRGSPFFDFAGYEGVNTTLYIQSVEDLTGPSIQITKGHNNVRDDAFNIGVGGNSSAYGAIPNDSGYMYLGGNASNFTTQVDANSGYYRWAIGAGNSTPTANLTQGLFTLNGNFTLASANSKITQQRGTTAGQATLTSGLATVSTAAVTANSVIKIYMHTPSGTIGILGYNSARVVGVSFNITASATDNSVYDWEITEQTP